MPQTQYGEIEIGLYRSQPEVYEVELRVTDPGTEGEVAPARGQARISLEKLRDLHESPGEYGAMLADQVFGDPAIREFYLKNRVAFDSRGILLRLRLRISSSALELHSLRWELLLDPETKVPLATSERILFSRFMLSRDWRVVKLKPKAKLKALVAVSAPTNVTQFGLADVDRGGEVARARHNLDGIELNVLGVDQPLTLDALVEGIRQGTDVLYLVCHGAIRERDNNEPCLYLQKPDGTTAVTRAGTLAQRLGELQEVPRLIVLASCESAPLDAASAEAALAPRLAEAGVPAVLAMQGRVGMETVQRAMPVFFRELLQDGQIDRALAVARRAVRERHDFWMPALFLRLKTGRIWYEPGFGGGDGSNGDGSNDDVPWDSVCRSAMNGDLVPIIGPDLAEHIFGNSSMFTAELARLNDLTLPPTERPDAAKIAQRITTRSGSNHLREQIRGILHAKLLDKANTQLKDLSPPDLMSLVVDELRKDPDDPFRILSELNVKVYVNGAADPLLKLFLKKAGKRPTEMFSDWRAESKVDEIRLLEASDALCEAFSKATGNTAVDDILNAWRDGLLRKDEQTLPVSLEAAADLVEEMLQDEPDKSPLAVAEAWRDSIRKPPTDTPARPLPPETPLIYYIFGRSRYETTWVLTEDDFFDQLIRVTKNDLLPRIVADKLVAGSLLFLGFPLDDWKFRLLFRMILSKDGKGLLKSQQYFHVGVQVDPEEYTPREAERIRKFLQTYFNMAANINIYWGSAADFLKGMRDHLKDPKFQQSQTPKATAPKRAKW